MSIEKNSIPYPVSNSSEENETFLKWCFNNGNEGKDLWSKFAYNSRNNEPINLIGSNLENLNLQGIYLAGVKLGGSNLSNSIFTSANLFEANLVGANLTNTKLAHANLNEADFFKANLTNTNFTNAYLKNAYFKDAKMKDTIFEKADLEGTNLDLDEKQNLVETNKVQEEIQSKEDIVINDNKNNQYPSNLSNKIIDNNEDNFVSEIRGSVELIGNMFQKNINLKDINFFTNKISNILRQTFNVTNTSKILKNNFNISLGNIEENILNLNLNLNFGIKLPPLVLAKQMQIWDIVANVIDTLKLLGEFYNCKEILKISNSSSIKDDIIISNKEQKQFIIENYIYKIIYNTLNDISELNSKIYNNELEYLILNDKELISTKNYKYIYKGIDIFIKIKEHQITDIFQAQIEVFEFNTITNRGKAIIYKANYKNATILEHTEFEVENESISNIIQSMNKTPILVNFKPIIENLGNKKLLKKMILTL